ncbi:MAG: glycosyltransferase family 1 protein [Archangiaceae bacterium]|nr:glycosyltransferase family 1 protein [Archangiaceae bacterium]
MRALIGAFGTRGDVQPMVALGKGLVARGHQVTLVVPPESVPLVKAHGLEAHPAGLDYEAISKRVASGRLRDVFSVLPLLRGQPRAHLDAMEPLAQKADLLIGSSVFLMGPTLAERFDIPYAYFALVPLMLDSDENPGPIVPLYGLPRWANRLLWGVTRTVWNVAIRRVMNGVRRSLGLGPRPDVWSEVLGSRPHLAVDAALAKGPSRHRNPVVQTGSLVLDDGASLSADTEAFLSAGEPPVYLGFGSMSDPDPRGTTARLVEAARLAGARAIISRGWAGLGLDPAPPHVHFAGAEPHGALFPRCAGVVHHGGAGTTHAAARAAVPQLVLPQILDQFFWRRCTAAAGVSPPSVDRYGKDPRPLASALRAMRDDAALRERAKALAARMSTDGVTRAVDSLLSRR